MIPQQTLPPKKRRRRLATSHPACTINVLRADQLEVAEGRRVTGKLYSDNIQTLVGKANGIGSEQLQKDLDRERCIGLP
jgi:hypothetical protein